jgi:hypothetical protein
MLKDHLSLQHFLLIMKTIHHLILLTCLALFCASCAKQDSQTQEPIKEAPKKVTTSTTKPKASKASVAAATNLFRTPSDDLALPTDAQIAEGDQSAAIQSPAQPDPSAPSISINPPANPSPADKP